MLKWLKADREDIPKYGSADVPTKTQVKLHDNGTTGKISYNDADNLIESSPSINEENDTIDIDIAIDKLGNGLFHYVALLSCGLCFMTDSMEISLLSFLSATLKEEWELTSTEAATITSLVFLGETLGTLFWGRMGDKYGRKPIFLAASITICVSGIGTSIVNDYFTLIFMRFCVGFGVGGMIVPFDIFAEFLPLKTRGKYLMYINYFWSAGSALVAILAYLTLNGEVKHWRLFVFLCALPSLFSAILCWSFIPESPRWLLSQGREKEAMGILRDVADWNGIQDVFKSGVVLTDTHIVENSSYAALFSPKWRRLTFLLWGVWFGYGFSYNGAVLATTRVFKKTSSAGVSASFNFKSIFISALSETIGVFIAASFVDSAGRIASQIAYFSLAGFAVAGMLLVSDDKIRLKTFYALSARAFELGANCISWVTAAEVLTTEIRNTGHSAANAVCRFGGFLVSYAVEGNTTLNQLTMMMTFAHVLEVFCCFFLPETKGLAMGSVN